jgi:hypothetical protein
MAKAAQIFGQSERENLKYHAQFTAHIVSLMACVAPKGL